MFRKEVMEQQKKRLSGQVVLQHSLSIRLMVIGLLSILASLAMYLGNATYTRKQTVSGYVRSSNGVIKAYANKPAIVSKVHIKANQKVIKGMVIAELMVDAKAGKEQDNADDAMLKSLQEQLYAIQQEQQARHRATQRQLIQLQEETQGIDVELGIIETQIHLNTEKLDALLQRKKEFNTFYKQGYISGLEYQQHREHRINTRLAIQSLRQSHQALSNRKLALRHDREQRQMEGEQQSWQLRQREQAIRTEMTNTSYQYHQIITAQRSGKVAAVHVVTGEQVYGRQPLVSIIPEDSQWIAELLVPSRAAGMVRRGDRVRLRLEAFPYQRFGSLQATITHIDEALLVDGETPVPLSVKEPYYRIHCHLQQGHVSAYGQTFLLKNGLILEADILLDSRTLLDWLLDPVRSLRGKLS